MSENNPINPLKQPPFSHDRKIYEKNGESRPFEIRGLVECKICKKRSWTVWRKAARLKDTNIYEDQGQVESNLLWSAQIDHTGCMDQNYNQLTLNFVSIQRR